MKKSQLRNIIRESIRELKTKKGLLTENCAHMAGTETSPHNCMCYRADGISSGACEGQKTWTRHANCNVTISHDCGCCIGMTDPKRGGEQAPEELGL